MGSPLGIDHVVAYVPQPARHEDADRRFLLRRSVPGRGENRRRERALEGREDEVDRRNHVSLGLSSSCTRARQRNPAGAKTRFERCAWDWRSWAFLGPVPSAITAILS